jgi:thiol-disulfide isomerase/thioredoxin
MRIGLSRLTRIHQQAALSSLVVVFLVALGCSQNEQAESDSGQSKFEVAENTDSAGDNKDAAPAPGDVAGQAEILPPMNGGGPSQPPPISSDQLDGGEVPDGTPEELLAYINNVDQKLMQIGQQLMQIARQGGQPAIGGQNALAAQQKPLLENKLAAAEKILSASPTDAKIRKQAIEAKLNAMAGLRSHDPDQPWGERVGTFAKSLVSDSDPNIALQGRIILFSLRVGELGNNEITDYAGFLKELEAFLAEENRGQDVIDVAQYAAFALSRMGKEQEYRQALQMIADAFQDHEDPNLVQQATNILDRLRLMDLEIEQQVQAVMRDEEGADEKLLATAKQVLAGPDLGPVVLQEFVPIGATQSASLLEVLEQTGHCQLGAQIGQLVKEAAAKIDDERLREAVVQSTESMLRRMALVGKPLELQGQKLDGTPFDFSKYQGKIILVDFWATWCGPCVQELPNILENYNKYHDKGFEVIGVNLDQSPQSAQTFLENREIPWENLIGNELAQKFGVESIPFVVLTDENGIVIDLHVRGARLGQKLAELLGPADAPASVPDAALPVTPPANDS